MRSVFIWRLPAGAVTLLAGASATAAIAVPGAAASTVRSAPTVYVANNSFRGNTQPVAQG